jgi:hypothetical protein
MLTVERDLFARENLCEEVRCSVHQVGETHNADAL